MSVEIFEQSAWQMSLGERAAVEGVLAQLKPSLAIEIGSMEGGCLQRIAAHASEAHSFDLQPPTLPMLDNVVLHTGDSHQLLAPFLVQLTEQERNVDFVLVDGDHSADGVRRDLEDLLDSRALADTIILIHDSANEEVRRGLDEVRFAAWPKVAHVELDWIPGQLFAEPMLRNELWQGLGLVVINSARLAYRNGPVYEQRYRPAAWLLAQARDLVLARERLPAGVHSTDRDDDAARERIALLEAELGESLVVRQRAQMLDADLDAARRRVTALEAELGQLRGRTAGLETEALRLLHRSAGCEQALQNIKGSVSWRMTEPLRNAKRLVHPRALRGAGRTGSPQ